MADAEDFQRRVYPYRRSADQDAATPVRHPVVVVGAGPVGLALAIDLALQDVPVVLLDNDDRDEIALDEVPCAADDPADAGGVGVAVGSAVRARVTTTQGGVAQISFGSKPLVARVRVGLYSKRMTTLEPEG
mgnify:CR=1 FL=1